MINLSNIKTSTKFLIALSCVFITNLLFASSFELSFDEAYYWIYSENLAFGYFDHPPMVAVFIKLGTLFFGNTEFGVRLFFNILMCASMTLLWYGTNKKNLLPFLLVFLSMPLLVFSGILALPDTPLLFFSICYFISIKKYLIKENSLNSLLVCLSILGMFYSKYHGLLIVLLTVLALPHLLKRKTFWFIGCGVVLGYLPHMYWQYTHDFVSFKFHLTGRVEKHFDVNNILNYIVSQIALMGFFIFFLFLKVWKSVRNKSEFDRVLIFNTIGFFVFLFFMSFRNQIEANWTVTCSAALVLYLVDKLTSNQSRWLFRLSLPVITLMIGMKLILIKPSTFFDLSQENRINEIVGWKNKKIPQIMNECQGLTLIADSYQIASKLSFYLDLKIPAMHFGSRDSQYNYLNYKMKVKPSELVCYLTSKKLKGSVKIESGYKDPVYILKDVKLSRIFEKYKVSYEEVFRNAN